MPNRSLTYAEFKLSYRSALDIPNLETRDKLVKLIEDTNEDHMKHLKEDVNASYCLMLHAYKEGLLSDNHPHLDQLNKIVQHSKEAARLQRLSDEEYFRQCPIEGHYIGDHDEAKLLAKLSKFEVYAAHDKVDKLKEQIKITELYFDNLYKILS
jgi:hypothetical protein